MSDFGPLETLLQNPDIMEIMINGPDSVYIWDRWKGHTRADIQFDDSAHLREIMDRVLASFGETISFERPIVNTRLTDGSTVRAIIPPISIHGPVMTISRTMTETMTMERLVENDNISQAAADYLRACVLARLNIIVYGGFLSGKHTLLNVLANQIPHQARVIALHSIADNTLQHHDKVVLETRPADIDGKGAVTVKHLLDLALEMSPMRLIVGEIEGEEVGTLVSIMSAGYNVMAAMTAVNPRDVLARLETFAIASFPSAPLLRVRSQMATGIHVLVGLELMADGLRRITRISEISGLRGDDANVVDLFTREEGQPLRPDGTVSNFLERLQGIDRSTFAD
jgi:pilus assembly protein CpaF